MIYAFLDARYFYVRQSKKKILRRYFLKIFDLPKIESFVRYHFSIACNFHLLGCVKIYCHYSNDENCCQTNLFYSSRFQNKNNIMLLKKRNEICDQSQKHL